MQDTENSRLLESYPAIISGLGFIWLWVATEKSKKQNKQQQQQQ
jgi:hypothetical protein